MKLTILDPDKGNMGGLHVPFTTGAGGRILLKVVVCTQKRWMRKNQLPLRERRCRSQHTKR